MNESEFFNAVTKELISSRQKYPHTGDPKTAAMVEEAGEVAKAIMDEPWERVEKECVQLAAMAVRLCLEGDSTLEDYRRSKGLDLPFIPKHPEKTKAGIPIAPEGFEWHRSGGWNPKQFTQGYRPLLLGEATKKGDEWWYMGRWNKVPESELGKKVGRETRHHRTLRGLLDEVLAPRQQKVPSKSSGEPTAPLAKVSGASGEVSGEAKMQEFEKFSNPDNSTTHYCEACGVHHNTPSSQEEKALWSCDACEWPGCSKPTFFAYRNKLLCRDHFIITNGAPSKPRDEDVAVIAGLVSRLRKAERSLRLAGYTDAGGELWKPPVASVTGRTSSTQENQSNIPKREVTAGMLIEATRLLQANGWECSIVHDSIIITAAPIESGEESKQPLSFDPTKTVNVSKEFYIPGNHIPGFRPLIEGERWHRIDGWKAGDLPEGKRPMLYGSDGPSEQDLFLVKPDDKKSGEGIQIQTTESKAGEHKKSAGDKLNTEDTIKQCQEQADKLRGEGWTKKDFARALRNELETPLQPPSDLKQITESKIKEEAHPVSSTISHPSLVWVAERFDLSGTFYGEKDQRGFAATSIVYAKKWPNREAVLKWRDSFAKPSYFKDYYWAAPWWVDAGGKIRRAVIDSETGEVCPLSPAIVSFSPEQKNEPPSEATGFPIHRAKYKSGGAGNPG